MSSTLESTLENINEKITSLNMRVDHQLSDTVEDCTPLTDTLRGSLKSCIRMIGDTLNQLETLDEVEEAAFDWMKQKKKLIKKRKQLEVMLQASGRLDISSAREALEIRKVDEDSWPHKNGKLSGKKRERDSHNTASSLFGSESTKKRSIGERDKPKKGSLWDLQFGSADLLAKLDEESSSESESSSSTDDLEKILSEKEDLLSMLGDEESDSSSGSEYSSSEDELKLLLENSSAKKKQTSSFEGNVFDMFRFGSGGAPGKSNAFIGTSGKSETIDETGLTSSYGDSEDTNIEGYRRKKKKGRYFALTEGKKDYEMQDTHYCETGIMENVNLYTVFDGHSKDLCSKALTKIFPVKLKEYLKKEGLSSDLTNIWTPLFLEVDEGLLQYEECGSTGTSVLIWSHEGRKYLQAANLGDSFAYLYRGGQPLELTVPGGHKLSNPDERQRLIEHGEDITPGQTRLCGLNVTRVFGDHFGKSVDCGLIAEPFVSPVFELTESDSHVVLASDGLWDVMNENEAYEIISTIKDAQDMSHTLMKTAMRNTECQDNITVIVIKL
eukprot:TRINITY_DN588_c0_g1_i1.p1 TRINITY_DN588_c0_g1~~TRINITY_DN588_c0_g1_i1.p1  ORF type:complete len:554 (-),score=152.47 TRINITY_DN588_c0_g1_i1:59-1720(-)